MNEQFTLDYRDGYTDIVLYGEIWLRVVETKKAALICEALNEKLIREREAEAE